MFIMYRRHSVSKVYNRKFARKIIFTNRDQDILYFSFIKRIWISQFQQDMISECWIYKTSCEIIFKFCYQYNLSVIIATFFEVHMVHLLRLSFFIWYHLWKTWYEQNILVTKIYISQNCLKKYTYKLRSSIFLLYQLMIILW